MKIIATTRNNADARALDGQTFAGIKCRHNGGKTLIFECTEADWPALRWALDGSRSIAEYIDPTLSDAAETEPHNEVPEQAPDEPVPETIRNSVKQTCLVFLAPEASLLVVQDDLFVPVFCCEYTDLEALAKDIRAALQGVKLWIHVFDSATVQPIHSSDVTPWLERRIEDLETEYFATLDQHVYGFRGQELAALVARG
jgi:hypothetical protein